MSVAENIFVTVFLMMAQLAMSLRIQIKDVGYPQDVSNGQG